MDSTPISILALAVSILSLIIAIKRFSLKSGLDIRGYWGVAEQVGCEDKFVSRIMIENLKDKALVIFDVYLLIGHNYYLEIESFENCPLIIKPFEVYSKQFPPIEYYYSNNIKVKLNEMLESKNINKRLVLSTSNGKYIVKSNKKQWFLIQDIFKNNQTMWITPIRYNLNGTYYPPNAVYVVKITMANKKENVPIYTSFYNSIQYLKSLT